MKRPQLECSHVEEGACKRCKRPMVYYAPEEQTVTRLPSVRKTNRPERTPDLLKFFMKENAAFRAKLRFWIRVPKKEVTVSHLLYT